MAHEAGKGSRPRPFSVTQQEYDQRWDAIFSRDLKEDNMQVRVNQFKEGGVPCGCGRSPTGFCIGWHGLTEEQFRAKLAEYNQTQQGK
jgi:hypothetical protein